MKNVVNICGINIHNISLDYAIEAIDLLIRDKKEAYVVTPNIDHIVKLQRDKEFKAAYDGASLVLADGVPILWASTFLGNAIKEKISGSDLFPELCKIASEKGYKLFFLGGRPMAAGRAADVLRKRHPGINIVGEYCPPFGFENDERENGIIINMIRNADPDILFVGLGAPKQEKWIYKHRHEYRVPVSIGIGASFEFVSNMVRRAPEWMQRCGLEWLWRLMMEPGRLWKRYLVDDVQFFWLVLKQKTKSL